MVSNGTTLTGYVDVDGVAGFQAGDRPVFTLALSGTNNETWTFTLQDQLDHAAPPAGTAVENTLAIDFSSFLTAHDFDLDTITLDAGSIVVTVIDDIPINQSATSSTGTVEEEQLANFNAGFGSTGNEDELPDPIDADAAGVFTNTTAVATGSLAGAVLVGADEAATYGLRQIPNATPENSGLTSKGLAVLVVSNGTTLTGYVDVDGVAGFQAGDRPVFTLALSGTNNETWTFTLQDQLDHAAPPAGTAVENTLAIDFSSFLTAHDFDLDTITLDAGSIVVTVIDDIPINQSATSSTGTVEEEQLANFNAGFGSTGNEDELPDPIDADAAGVFTNTTAVATGSLAGAVLVGADEAATYGLRQIPNATPENSGLTSKGLAVLVVSNGTTLTGYVDVDGVAGFQAGDRPVFTLALSGTNNETWTFTLQDQLDHAAPPAGTAVENTLAIDFSSFLTAHDFDLDTITLDAGSIVVTVIDDIPINQSATSSTGTVEEEQLANFNAGFGSTGNEDELPDPIDADAAGVFTNTTAVATGSLAGAVLVGADEAATYGLRQIRMRPRRIPG